MPATPVIAIFDVGKTNKKLLLFDERYKLVHEESIRIPETADEDGFPCEDVYMLTQWMHSSFSTILKNTAFDVRAINFSGYGASFVHLGKDKKICAPLYNYLKPFPEELKRRFYDEYGGEQEVSKQTASPVLGFLNSGLQLYWLKHHHAKKFNEIQYSLHLPQYLSFVIGGEMFSDLTSIGCHTNLWNFQNKSYHRWVAAEGIDTKLAPVVSGSTSNLVNIEDRPLPVGVGLHDSSAALIPYLESFAEPFVLISTGTWCISLNPFNNDPLTVDELEADCLCYLSFKGEPVKASRLFAGHEHEEWVKKLSAHFHRSDDFYNEIRFNPEFLSSAHIASAGNVLDYAKTYEEAYHIIMAAIVEQQKKSTGLVLVNQSVKRIFVDGGFSKNEVYMNLLAAAFGELEVFAASVPQSTGMGAAIAIHKDWNSKSLPSDIIQLKYYSVKQNISL